MNVPDPSDRDAADEQASIWAARLDGATLSRSDREQLQAWMSVSPAHRARLAAYCQLSTDLERTLSPLASCSAAKDTVSLRPLSSSRSRGFGFGLAAAAAAIAIALYLQAPFRTLPIRQISTAPAQRESLALPDGSHVEVSAHSRLRLQFTEQERRIRLAGGEAYFKVSRDRDRPFFVETPAGSIRVTGTAFGVRTLAGSGLTVLVEEGSVQVRAGDADAGTFELSQGQRLRMGTGAPVVDRLSQEEIAAALAWREGQAVFAGTSLSEALACFARYHDRALTAAPDAATFTLGGRYQLDDLEGFLSALELVLPVRLERETDGTVRIYRRTAD